MSINIDDIEAFFTQKNLDVKIKGNNPRFIDQKCAPDVLSFIASMILHLNIPNFSVADIWENSEFIKLIPLFYNKPSPDNQSATNEYDKFISQNLCLLTYAEILERQKDGTSYLYTVINEEILKYIAENDRHAFLFLNAYFNNFLSDNNLTRFFNSFFEKQNKESFKKLKERFRIFLLFNTEIGSRGSDGKFETGRIFPKLLNPLAVNKHAKGVIRGQLSKGIMTYSELMYNRENFRDTGKKEKHETRKESVDKLNDLPDDNLLIANTKILVKRLHTTSEVKDNMSGKTEHIHHIFPKNEFPSISYYKENLIALTSGQHLGKAHPNGNVMIADIEYQKLCLVTKKNTIQKDAQKNYSKESFIHVLNVGFGWIGTDKELSTSASFKEIDKAIDEYYRHA